MCTHRKSESFACKLAKPSEWNEHSMACDLSHTPSLPGVLYHSYAGQKVDHRMNCKALTWNDEFWKQNTSTFRTLQWERGPVASVMFQKYLWQQFVRMFWINYDCFIIIFLLSGFGMVLKLNYHGFWLLVNSNLIKLCLVNGWRDELCLILIKFTRLQINSVLSTRRKWYTFIKIRFALKGFPVLQNLIFMNQINFHKATPSLALLHAQLPWNLLNSARFYQYLNRQVFPCIMLDNSIKTSFSLHASPGTKPPVPRSFESLSIISLQLT